MKSIYPFLFLFLIGLGSLPAHATIPIESFLQLNTYKLRAGQSRTSVTSSFSSYDQRFSPSGTKESLGKPFSKKTTWAELLNNNSPDSKQKLQKFMVDQNLDESAVAYETNYKVRQTLVQVAPVWNYGLTNRWMIGVRLPVRVESLDISSESIQSQDFQKFQATSRTESNSLNSNSRIAAPTEQEETINVGDVELMSAYRLREDPGRYSLLATHLVRFPTSETSDPLNYVRYQEETPGQFDIGLGLAGSYRMTSKVSLWAHAQAVMQTSDKVQLSTTSADGRGSDTLEVSRDAGDYFEFVMRSVYEGPVGFSFFGGYGFKSRQRDQYSEPELQVDPVLQELGQESYVEVASAGFRYRNSFINSLDIRRAYSLALEILSPVRGERAAAATTTNLNLSVIY